MQGRTVVVTGGFGSLGRAVGEAFLERGAQVALVDFAATPPADFPDRARAALCLGGVDLADPQQAAATLAAVKERFGHIDALVNIAGAFRWQTLEQGDIANWDMLFRTNVMTAANAARAALPYLRESGHGRIVNIGANAAQHAAAGMGAYAASKSGVHRLTESLAEELKQEGITVNAVLPSIIDTPANRHDMPDADFTRWVSAGDLAQVIAFLLSDAASAITGALIPVTGRV